MRIPDLAEMIDEWEHAHTYEVMEMTMGDKLFKQDSKRISDMIAAMYQVPAQLLKAEGKAITWEPESKTVKTPYKRKFT